MSADFVVCNKYSSIVAVIELDDATHQRNDRQAADAKKDKALGSGVFKLCGGKRKHSPTFLLFNRLLRLKDETQRFYQARSRWRGIGPVRCNLVCARPTPAEIEGPFYSVYAQKQNH